MVRMILVALLVIGSIQASVSLIGQLEAAQTAKAEQLEQLEQLKQGSK